MTDTPKPIDPNCPKCKGHGSTQRELAPNFIKHEACDCVAPDPRPTDMAELARLTAVELRKRGIWAFSDNATVRIGRQKPCGIRVPCAAWTTEQTAHSMHTSAFDNLGPVGCADEIQRQESAHAQEWAGDK